MGSSDGLNIVVKSKDSVPGGNRTTVVESSIVNLVLMPGMSVESCLMLKHNDNLTAEEYKIIPSDYARGNPRQVSQLFARLLLKETA